MLPVLQIGPLAIQTPGLVLLIGIWLGLTLSERHSMRFGVPTNILSSMVLIGLITGVVGARLGYILRMPESFFESPLSIFSLNPGLLDPWGAMVSGMLGVLIYGQRQKLGFWQVLDSITPFIAVVAIAVGLAHLASGSAFGSPTNMPWAIELWGAKRHPTQVYELLAAGLILAFLWPASRPTTDFAPGQYALLFLICSAAARLFIEYFRGDSVLILGGYRAVQIAAWFLLAWGLWQYHHVQKTFGGKL